MRAYRMNNLLLERPVPEKIVGMLRTRGFSRWETLVQEPGWTTENGKSVFKTVTREQVEVMNLVSYLPGFVSVPRYLFSDSDLYMGGYAQIIEAPSPGRAEALAHAPSISMRPGGQESAYRLALTHEHGSIVLGPGRGKTVLAVALAGVFGEPFAVVVDEEGLAHQWIKAAQTFLGLHEDDIGLVKGKKRMTDFRGKTMTVIMSRTLCAAIKANRMPLDMVTAFGTVFYDEAHKMWTEKTGTPALSAFAARRFALTGTPKNDDRSRIMTAHCGRILIEDRKHEMKPICFFHGISAADAPPRYQKASDYTKINSFFLGNSYTAPEPTYLESAVKLFRSLLDRDRTVFALSERVRFMREVRDQIGSDLVGIIDGDTPGPLRQRILHSFPIVLASRSIGEQALDNEAIDAVVLSMPFGRDKSGLASNKSMQQGVGRGLRLMDGKENCELHVLYPKTSYGRRLAEGVELRCKDLDWTVQKPMPRRNTKKRREDYQKKRRERAQAALNAFKRNL